MDVGILTRLNLTDGEAGDYDDSFVRGHTPDTLASDALSDFLQFPKWLWRNAASPTWSSGS